MRDLGCPLLDATSAYTQSDDISGPSRGNLSGLGSESPGAIAVASKALLHRGMAVTAADGGDPLVNGRGRLPASGDGWAAVQQVPEHPSSGPRPDDDAASEGGQSAMSAQSGTPLRRLLAAACCLNIAMDINEMRC